MDLRQTKEYGNFLNQIGWVVERHKTEQYFIKKIPLLGAAIKLQRVSHFPLKQIEKLSKKYRIFEIIFEPEMLSKKELILLKQNGYKLSNNPYLPTKTLRIDISKPTEEILKEMKKDARYSIRKSQKLVTNSSQNIELFESSWRSAVGTKRHVLPLHELKAIKNSFGNNMTIIMNEFHTSGALFLIAGGVCYYWVGFTDEFARKSLIQYQVLWKGIQWAKKHHAKTFDFEGIYDERFPKKDWKGFTHFKRSFGGTEVEYPGCYIKWRIPL